MHVERTRGVAGQAGLEETTFAGVKRVMRATMSRDRAPVAGPSLDRRWRSAGLEGQRGLHRPTAPEDERHDKKNQKDDEEDLSNPGGCTGDAAKPEDGGSDCDQEKENCVSKHGVEKE